jgi:ribonucleoside-diphosphate reductase alpha chain
MMEEADRTSCERGAIYGTYGFWKGSKHDSAGKRRRNSTLLAIAPTGTTSLIADVSPGIEPNFALAYTRMVADSGEMLCVNPVFEEAMADEGVAEDVVRQIAKRGFIAPDDDIPDELRHVFVTAQQVEPGWHIRIQAAFQQHVDGAISKTINFPSTASVRDIEEGMLLAWHLGCKGLTAYRDGSLNEQVLVAGGDR